MGSVYFPQDQISIMVIIFLQHHLIIFSLVFLILEYSLQLCTFEFFILSLLIPVVNSPIIFYFTQFWQLLDLSRKQLFSIVRPVLITHVISFPQFLACGHYSVLFHALQVLLTISSPVLQLVQLDVALNFVHHYLNRAI